MSGYEGLWEAIKATNDDLAAGTLSGFSPRKPGQSGECSNDGQANAVRAIYDIRNRNSLYDSLDERLSSFWTRRTDVWLNGVAFSSKDVGGTLTFMPSNKRVVNSFPNSSGGANRAVFNAKLVEGEVVFSTDEHRSRINGGSISQYSSPSVDVRQKTISDCAKEALDELVTPASGGSGDGDGSSGGLGVFTSGGGVDYCQRSYQNGPDETITVAHRC